MTLKYTSQAYNLNQDSQWCPYGIISTLENITSSCQWRTECWKNILLFPNSSSHYWFYEDANETKPIIFEMAPGPTNERFDSKEGCGFGDYYLNHNHYLVAIAKLNLLCV